MLQSTNEFQNTGFPGGFGGFGGGGGFGAFGLIGLLGLNSLNRDGRRDCDDGGGSRVFEAAILSKLGTIEGAVPLAASAIQNSILEQSLGFTSQLNQSTLSQLQATTNVKDTVQNGTTALLLNNAQNTQQLLQAICGLGSKIDQNRISELETELSESRSHGRSREVEVNVSQTVQQVQAQQQQQQQMQSLFTVVSSLANDLQLVKQGQTIFNSGTMAASGTQAAANTKVN